MTTNFGCCESRTMASQPRGHVVISEKSVYSEERNRLRLRAWEQRNQETGQTKELNAENVPLFGEPYKTNKGDELSSRIQRMLGSYEDVNNPNPFATEPAPACVTFSQSDQCQRDKSTKPPFHTQVHYMTTQNQKGPCSNSYSSQPTRTSTASSSPNQHKHLSTFSKASLNHTQNTQPGHSAHVQNKSEAFSDLRDHISLPQEMSAQSPDAESQDFMHSSDHNNTDTDTKGTFDRHELQGSTDLLLASSSNMDVSTFNVKQSPKDASLPLANKMNTLPSQTFPPLLSSKQPSVVMIQKPTAYVRPMDGQDQVVIESPELKPSPEPYAPLPELINKSDQSKTKIPPQFVETMPNEAQCVEDILREMTHSWPPLLTAIHTPRTDESSKSPFLSKEAKHVSSCPGQVSYGSPTNPSQLSQQNSSSFEAAHSSGVESASSSDSESSSRSESESESATEEPSQPTVKTEPDAPVVSHGDWQLGNWIRSTQQNSSTESQGGVLVSESPAHRQLLPSSNHSSVDVVNTIKDTKVSSQHKEFNDSIAKTQQCNESPQNNCYQQSSQQSPSVDFCKIPCNIHSSKPAKAGFPDHNEQLTALSVKHEEVSAKRAKDPCFPDRPKVKTKTRHSKKSNDSSDTKSDSKRTSKHMSLDKRKAEPEPEPEVTLVLYGHCPSCGVRYPNPCSCSSQSPVQADQLSPAPPVRICCSKVKPETTCQKGTKMPHKTIHKHSEKTGHTNKGCGDLGGPPRSLLVTIDLTLLSRVPQTSRSHQKIPSSAKRSALVVEQLTEGGSDASTIHKRTKTGKKSIPQNAEVDNKPCPKKKQKLENMNTSSAHASAKLESYSNPAENREQKKAKKNHGQSQLPLTHNDSSKDSKLRKHGSADKQQSSNDPAKSKDSSKHKRKSTKQTEHPHLEKQGSKSLKSSIAVPLSSQPNREALTNRPLLKFEDGQYPVKHYIKEAKKLKHKADAESDKLSKAFNYLDAAMYFVESGIAMDKDPQISVSSYTMFAETVELLKFVIKLKNSVDPLTPPADKDFLALCLKCQSLLQMAMFRHKHKTALEYSKTLTDHFSSSAQVPHDPSVSTFKVTSTSSSMPDMPSPASTSTNSVPGFNHSVSASSVLALGSVGSSVTIPQAIEQVAFTYVNITTLFLSAHDTWEQAEELAHKGSGMLAELDTVMGPLSLTSSMTSMVHYTRQGVHWLRLDSPKVK